MILEVLPVTADTEYWGVCWWVGGVPHCINIPNNGGLGRQKLSFWKRHVETCFTDMKGKRPRWFAGLIASDPKAKDMDGWVFEMIPPHVWGSIK